MLSAADNEILVRTNAGTPMGEYFRALLAAGRATDIGVVHFRRLMLKEAKALRGGIEPAAARKPGSYRLRSGGAVPSSELSFEEVMKQRFGSATGRVV